VGVNIASGTVRVSIFILIIITMSISVMVIPISIIIIITSSMLSVITLHLIACQWESASRKDRLFTWPR
jgi:hypothetical protein